MTGFVVQGHIYICFILYVIYIYIYLAWFKPAHFKLGSCFPIEDMISMALYAGHGLETCSWNLQPNYKCFKKVLTHKGGYEYRMHLGLNKLTILQV